MHQDVDGPVCIAFHRHCEIATKRIFFIAQLTMKITDMSIKFHVVIDGSPGSKQCAWLSDADNDGISFFK